MLRPHEFLTVKLSEQKYLVGSLILLGNQARINGGLMYGTEVPRPKLGLDFRLGVEPMCGTEVPKSKLGLRFRAGSTVLFFKSLIYTTLINYKSESCPLTNAWRDFPEQRRKANPTCHRMLGSFLETSLPGICAWVGTKFQSHNLSAPLSPKHPLRTDSIGPHYRAHLFKLEPSSKATITIFHSHLNDHLEQIILDL